MAALVRWHLRYSGGPPSASDLNSIAGAMTGFYNTNIKPLCHGNVTLEQITIQDIATTSGAQGVSVVSIVGTRTGGALPASNAALVNHTISRRYRGGKPRAYWPLGTSTDLTSASKWSSASVTAFNSGLASYLAATLGATSGSTTLSALVNVSYYQGFTNVPYGSPQKYRRTPTLRGGGPITDVVTSQATSFIPGTQRRRLRPR